MSWAILLIASACGQRYDGSGSTAAKVEQRVVSRPTVAELERQGFAQVDEESTSGSCGPNCIADGVSAIYLGREAEGDEFPQFPRREYKCPVSAGEMAGWKCRKLAAS
ncbi:hypothetical protein [Sphingopyxis panaciterrae]